MDALLFSSDAALRDAISDHIRADESLIVEHLCQAARFTEKERQRIRERASCLARHLRDHSSKHGGIRAFLDRYDLSSNEGVALMCLAESLLRVPDAPTASRLIRDKINPIDWQKHLGTSHSLFVNASIWGLMLAGRIGRSERQTKQDLGKAVTQIFARSSEAVIRRAMLAAMRILGKEFVLGRTIDEAIVRAKSQEKRGYRYSYDMLGESARTTQQAQDYFQAYSKAIAATGTQRSWSSLYEAPSISVKLSALHPRYEVAHYERVRQDLFPMVKILAQQAKSLGLGLTIDAEEADRLEMSLDLIQFLATDPDLAQWDGLGFAVQAYQKRALPVLDWLCELAHHTQHRFIIRLVKGAYWDYEIKTAQERGLSGYPVFTRKLSTDVSYLACAKRLFADKQAFYPAFATHNAHTVAAVMEIAQGSDDWEYQRLHGMGEELYDQVIGKDRWNRPCRIYAPVGSHEDLLAYLVRRLLENGANSSFINRINDAQIPIEALIADPVERLLAIPIKPHPYIALPRDLFGQTRINSQGLDLNDRHDLALLSDAIARSRPIIYQAAPLIDGTIRTGQHSSIASPSDRHEIIGTVITAQDNDSADAMNSAHQAFPQWNETPATDRARILDHAADLFQSNLPDLAALIIREAGRIQADAVAEVREAIDFLRYYAAQARQIFSTPLSLPGPVGEQNTLSLNGRGVFVCISPWNFPLAIFTGQIAAALAAGNSVVAKPAEQTPLCGAMAIKLLHQAGIPTGILNFLPGDGDIGRALVESPLCAGVAFTGSVAVAKAIARQLSAKDGPLVPLIAETGGQNALIVDSSALPEQVVRDALISAFNSAGQRCSALRIMFIQADIADKVIAMLKGAMQELRIGDPADLRTDIGPIIDEKACAALYSHVAALEKSATLIQCCDLDSASDHGVFFAPRAYEIKDLSILKQEVFGPILHIVRWKADELDKVCEAIAATGYGLTLGIHSRIDETVTYILKRVPVGNSYVNRTMIGAVVGVQPFGGERLSGTGPKAGGPHYLYRFATERTVTIDKTAAGGNASLLALEDEA